ETAARGAQVSRLRRAGRGAPGTEPVTSTEGKGHMNNLARRISTGLALVAGTGASAVHAQRPDLSGRWTFHAAQSDHPRDRQEARPPRPERQPPGPPAARRFGGGPSAGSGRRGPAGRVRRRTARDGGGRGRG